MDVGFSGKRGSSLKNSLNTDIRCGHRGKCTQRRRDIHKLQYGLLNGGSQCKSQCFGDFTYKGFLRAPSTPLFVAPSGTKALRMALMKYQYEKEKPGTH